MKILIKKLNHYPYLCINYKKKRTNNLIRVTYKFDKKYK